MLDDDERVAEVAQLLERVQELFVVALVQADARLVEDVQHPHQARADLSGQTDALGLAAGECRGRARERQIAEADARQKAQTGADLLEDALGDQAVLLAEREAVDEFQRLDDGQIREIRDAHAADRHGQRRLLQTSAVAGGAVHLGHALLDIGAHGGALRLLVAALEVIDDALELALDDAVALVALVAQLKRLALRAVEDGVHGLLRQVPERIGQLEMIALGQRLEIHAGDRVPADVVPAGGDDAAVHDREIGVGHDELRIDQKLHAEPRTGRAGAVRVVEGEQARLQLLDGDAAVLAGVVLRKAQQLVPPGYVDVEQAAGEPQRRLRRVRQTADDLWLDDKAVHHDLNVMLLVFLEPDLLGQIVGNAVDAGADIARTPRVLEYLRVLALFPADHRTHELELRACGQLHDAVNDLVDRLLPDLAPAFRTVRHADARPQQTHVVVDLRHRAHRGARVARGGFLVDGDGRGQAVNVVHVRLVHLPQKHPGVGAQALDIATLALGVDRVEGERGLAAARQARDHHELVARDLHVDVFQIVLPRALDENALLHFCSLFPAECRPFPMCCDLR